jgi:hypothetical protein
MQQQSLRMRLRRGTIEAQRATGLKPDVAAAPLNSAWHEVKDQRPSPMHRHWAMWPRIVSLRAGISSSSPASAVQAAIVASGTAGTLAPRIPASAHPRAARTACASHTSPSGVHAGRPLPQRPSLIPRRRSSCGVYLRRRPWASPSLQRRIRR